MGIWRQLEASRRHQEAPRRHSAFRGHLVGIWRSDLPTVFLKFHFKGGFDNSINGVCIFTATYAPQQHKQSGKGFKPFQHYFENPYNVKDCLVNGIRATIYHNSAMSHHRDH